MTVPYTYAECCSGCRPCWPEHDAAHCPALATCYRCDTCGDNACCSKCGDVDCCTSCGDSVCPETLCRDKKVCDKCNRDDCVRVGGCVRCTKVLWGDA